MGYQNNNNLIYIQAERDAKRRTFIEKISSMETLGSIMMVIAAVIAIILANTNAFEAYEAFLNFQLGITLNGFGFDNFFIGMTVEHWVNEVLMTLFFLVVGMEIKYEFFVGELKDIKAALLPIIAACGGVLVPIIIYVSLNFGGEHVKGFGIPMATDIAFAIGVLTLVGKGIPRGLTVFLKTLAIADDIMAIIVIALFYGHSPDPFWLVMAGLTVCILMAGNKMGVCRCKFYVVFGIVLWFCVYFSGIECTIAGVILAFTIPTKAEVNPRVFGKWTIAKVLEARDRFIPGEPMLAQGEYADRVYMIHKMSRRVEPTLSRMERKISPWSNYLILPVFAFCNAGVRLAGVDVMSIVTDPVVLGVFFGLFLGKPIGITLLSFISVRLLKLPMPSNCSWRHMLGAGMLGGIGFTMSIYVANLSFTGAGALEVTMMAKAAILCASVVSAVAGVAFLKIVLAADRKAGVKLDAEEDIEEEIKDEAKVLKDISKTATDTTMGEGEHLILTDFMGQVSEDDLFEAFKRVINEGDVYIAPEK